MSIFNLQLRARLSVFLLSLTLSSSCALPRGESDGSAKGEALGLAPTFLADRWILVGNHFRFALALTSEASRVEIAEIGLLIGGSSGTSLLSDDSRVTGEMVYTFRPDSVNQGSTVPTSAMILKGLLFRGNGAVDSQLLRGNVQLNVKRRIAVITLSSLKNPICDSFLFGNNQQLFSISSQHITGIKVDEIVISGTYLSPDLESAITKGLCVGRTFQPTEEQPPSPHLRGVVRDVGNLIELKWHVIGRSIFL